MSWFHPLWLKVRNPVQQHCTSAGLTGLRLRGPWVGGGVLSWGYADETQWQRMNDMTMLQSSKCARPVY